MLVTPILGFLRIAAVLMAFKKKTSVFIKANLDRSLKIFSTNFFQRGRNAK